MKFKEKISIEVFDGKAFKIRVIEPITANEKKDVIT
jgi:hypothetical protein